MISVAKIVKDVVDFKGEIRWDKSKPDGTLKKLTDVSRLSSLGWSAKTELIDGISLAYGDYLK